jgi:hypothetical protein
VPQVYDELKLFLLRVQNLNMALFQMRVVFVDDEVVSECLLLQVLDAMEGILSTQRLLCP